MHYCLVLGLHHVCLKSGNTLMIQEMFGTSYTDDGIVRQYNHWYTLWFGNNYTSDLTHYALSSHSIQITNVLAIIPISIKSSSTGTTTEVTTAVDICG